jgi:hypothetical protein
MSAKGQEADASWPFALLLGKDSGLSLVAPAT